MKRDLPYVWPGPELWRASKARWPEIFIQPDQVHLNELGDKFDAEAWYELLMRYDRGELERNLDSAWGADWRESIYLKENRPSRERRSGNHEVHRAELAG